MGGIFQCNIAKDKNDFWSFIEKSIHNKKTTLDKKIYEEYMLLKSLMKPKRNNERDFYKEKINEKDNFSIANKKNNFVSFKKRMKRFCKWYEMSHPNQNKEIKISKANYSDNKKVISNNDLSNSNNNNIKNITNNNNNKSTNLNFRNVNYASEKNYRSEGNLKNSTHNPNQQQDLETHNIVISNFDNGENNFAKNSKNENNEISPILNNKRVHFMTENEKNNDLSNIKNLNISTSNITINLNNKFSKTLTKESFWQNEEHIANEQTKNCRNCEVNNSSGNSNTNNVNSNSTFRNSKMASSVSIANLNSNLIANSNINSFTGNNSIPKIMLLKNQGSIKIIPRLNFENTSPNENNNKEKEKDKTSDKNNDQAPNNNLNCDCNCNNNHNNPLGHHSSNYNNPNTSDSSSSRNIETKKTLTSNSNTNTNTNTQNYYYNNNPNNNSDNFSSKSNVEKSTSGRLNKNNTTHRDDSNSNSAAEKVHSNNCTNKNASSENIINNLGNSSADNELNSSIYQKLNIFDDSNIIESNLRLFYKLNKNKSIKRISKGPPDSFRWISWIISSNLPIERSKEFYNYLLNQPLNSATDIQIKKDLNRTLSGIKISNSILDDTQVILYNVLKAFSNIDKEVSYCQGMNFIVGFLLIISDFSEVEAFYFMLTLFSSTFNDNLGIRGFFLEGFPMLNFYVEVFLNLFSKYLPELKRHFDKLEIPEEIWISKWYRTLFTLSLPFDICKRIWDCIIVLGIDFLLNFTLAFMKYIEQDLLKKEDLFDVIEYFKKMSPFFALENEGDQKLIFESEKFVENFNIEEIILNAKKIKITSTFIQEQMLLYEKKNKMSFSLLKKKYDIYNYPNAIQYNNTINNYQYDDIDLNSNLNDNDNISEYFFYNQGERKDNFYINTETCRSEMEKIKNNLENTKNKNIMTENNYNKRCSSSNIFPINPENNTQNIKSQDNSIINSNPATKDKRVIRFNSIHQVGKSNILNNLNTSNSNNSKKINNTTINCDVNKNNNSGDFEKSYNNSDSETNINIGIEDKITSYTFKTKQKMNETNSKVLNKFQGKID